MAIELVSETFASRIGEPFEMILATGERLETVLVACEATKYGDAEDLRERLGRVPFSLHFASPDRERYAPQQTFTVRHDELGEFELFLVPLGPEERGMLYEAVIN
jgi:Domain of unknown function (DUF6916)